jgi:hypothetical protein
MKEESNMKKVFGFAFVLALFSASAVPIFAGTTKCTGQVKDQTISGSLDVPAGATCTLTGDVVTGNVTVEGTLFSYGTKFDGNVTVTGGVITIGNGNGASSALTGNLTITGSSGNNQIGCPNFSNIINGNVSFTGNSGNFYVCSAQVGGSVTVSNNTRINNDYSGWWTADLNYMTVTKNLSCSGNSPAPTSSSLTGSTNSTIIASQKLGDCAGL